YGDHRDLHSFPTRRSSDLTAGTGSTRCAPRGTRRARRRTGRAPRGTRRAPRGTGRAPRGTGRATRAPAPPAPRAALGPPLIHRLRPGRRADYAIAAFFAVIIFGVMLGGVNIYQFP